MLKSRSLIFLGSFKAASIVDVIDDIVNRDLGLVMGSLDSDLCDRINQADKNGTYLMNLAHMKNQCRKFSKTLWFCNRTDTHIYIESSHVTEVMDGMCFAGEIRNQLC